MREMSKKTQNPPDLVISSIKLGFNNAGNENFYELCSQNKAALRGLKAFLIDMNLHGVVLSQDSFKALADDFSCTVYEGSATDPEFEDVEVRDKPATAHNSLDTSYYALEEYAKQNKLQLSETTKVLLKQELGIHSNHPPAASSTHSPEA